MEWLVCLLFLITLVACLRLIYVEEEAKLKELEEHAKRMNPFKPILVKDDENPS